MIDADIIIKSKNVFTGLDDMPKPLAVCVKDNKICDVLPYDDCAEFSYENTKVYDMGDKLITAGFCDSHVHLLMGCLMCSEADLSKAESEDEAAEILYDFYCKHKDRYKNGRWVLGFSWYNFWWDNKDFPKKETLDKYFKDIPVFLMNADGHGAWVNSKALELCGINNETPDPPHGKFLRTENGEPTGYLDEEAMSFCMGKAYCFTEDEEYNFYKDYIKIYPQNGITAVNDMQYFFGTNMGSKKVFERLDKAKELPVRINFAIGLLGDMNEIKECSNKYTSGKIYSNGLKEFVDGLIITHTAKMVDKYSDDKNADINVCESDLDAIAKRIIEVHKMGLNIQLHATGDGAVRFCLDCYENAVKTNGFTKSRMSVEHIDLIHPDDVHRFGEYGVIASIQPQHLALTDSLKDNPYPDCVGEREKYLWAYRLLEQNGAVLAFGTDYPTAGLNPMMTVYRAVTRMFNDMLPKDGWLPEQKLTVREAVMAYTLGAAYKIGREKELGTLEKGKLADITVWTENLFDIPKEKIKECECFCTMCDGKITYYK